MPDVREVYEMVTKQKPPDPGALERQRRRQVRASRQRKLSAFAVAAAIALAIVVVAFMARPTEDLTVPAEEPTPSETVFPVDPRATEVATGFAEAVGAFDAESAMSYLAGSADISEGVLPEELPLLLSLYEAQGLEQRLRPCRIEGTSASGTQVACPYSFHIFGSDDIGRGPWHGSFWDITVLDGEIAYAHQDWRIDRFSPEMWEPFADWVRSSHPADFDVMYADGGSNFRISEESVRLWDRNVDRYVDAVRSGDAE